MKKALVLAVAALFGGACGEAPKRPSIAADGPAPPGLGGVLGGGAPIDGGVEDASYGGDAGFMCTSLAPDSGIVDQNAVSEDPPAGMGGTIIDGVYDLTDARLHQGAFGLPGPTGSSYQGSIRVEGLSFERVIVLRSSAGAASEVRSSGNLSTSGTTATFMVTCPSPTQEQLTYSVANTSVTFSNLVTKESFTFTRQP